MPKKLTLAGAVLVAALGVLQLVQPERTNPPHNRSASFEALAGVPAPVASAVSRACGDCHSNRTVWPWYSKVSPVSWLVARDVQRGRTYLNLSEWNLYSGEMSRLRLGEMCEVVKAGRMPLPQYALLHPEAKMSAAEVSALCAAPQPTANSTLNSRTD